MIESLSGKIISVNNNELVLNIGPVNFSLLIPSSDKYLNLKEDLDITLKTILDVKAESLTIIGFLDDSERQLFKKLVTVKGVGSKVAIAILSTITTEEIIESVANDNHKIIKQVPGIGDKTAKLILIQLQGQLDNIPYTSSNLDLEIQFEASKAVEALGYDSDHIRQVINEINKIEINKNLDTENLIRLIIEKLSTQNQS